MLHKSKMPPPKRFSPAHLASSTNEIKRATNREHLAKNGSDKVRQEQQPITAELSAVDFNSSFSSDISRATAYLQRHNTSS
jgi:hypothetical protein